METIKADTPAAAPVPPQTLGGRKRGSDFDLGFCNFPRDQNPKLGGQVATRSTRSPPPSIGFRSSNMQQDHRPQARRASGHALDPFPAPLNRLSKFEYATRSSPPSSAGKWPRARPVPRPPQSAFEVRICNKIIAHGAGAHLHESASLPSTQLCNLRWWGARADRH
jgi:hypothetical protein